MWLFCYSICICFVGFVNKDDNVRACMHNLDLCLGQIGMRKIFNDWGLTLVSFWSSTAYWYLERALILCLETQLSDSQYLPGILPFALVCQWITWRFFSACSLWNVLWPLQALACDVTRWDNKIMALSWLLQGNAESRLLLPPCFTVVKVEVVPGA